MPVILQLTHALPGHSPLPQVQPDRHAFPSAVQAHVDQIHEEQHCAEGARRTVQEVSQLKQKNQLLRNQALVFAFGSKLG